ncbi:hypothetical protein [Pseudonocardia adelaidensis]|uniref:Transcriptional regulator, AbiEi antitoxin, Type IV TA system n=1 Tax=Pseudonocardia adelaidensis TaxID=648754 RepID=A0ABP9NSV2_9PSEU
MRQPLRDIAAAQHGAFSTAQAMSCYSRGELRALVSSGGWSGMFTGSYRLSSAEPGPRLRLSAAGLSIGREVPACLHTAAELHGFGVLDDVVTHVAVRPDEPCARRAELWPHQLALTADDVVRLRCGALATNADRTAIDLARILPRLDVLPVLDAALAAGVCTPGSLAAELKRHTGFKGIRQARELMPLARPEPESPQESRLRLRCHDAGLPTPTAQFPVLDSRGRPCRWLDLAWEDVKVGLDYDGEEGHTGRANLRSDRRRHNFLQDDGWAMFYATDLDVYRDFAELMRKVGTAIKRRTRGLGADQGQMVAREDRLAAISP